MEALKQPGKLALLFGGIVFLLLSIIYSTALPADFFSLDDRGLVDLPHFHSPLFWQSLKTIFIPGSAADYYPIRDLSYRLDIALFGFQPMAMRWMNIFYFSCSAATLFYLFLQFQLNALAAAGITLLWAVHPYHTEMVLWISARKDLLGILFALLSLSFFLNSKSSTHAKQSLFLSALFFALSCFSKAAFSLLPLSLALAIIWNIVPNTKLNKIYLLSIAAIGIASGLVCSWYYSQVNSMHTELSFLERLPIIISSLGKMVAGWYYFCSNQLELDEWGEWASANQLFFYIGLLAYSLYILALAIALKTRRRNLLFLLSVLLTLYLAVPGIVSAHRYAYATRYFEPIALAIFLALGLAAKTKLNNKYILFIYAAGLACFTYSGAQNWRDNLSFSLHDLESQPGSITKRTAVVRDLANAGASLSPEQSRLLADSLKFLQDRCETIGPIHSAQDAQLSCRTYLGLAWQMSLWKKDFKKAEHYVEAMQTIEYKNIQSPRQLERMKIELKLATGEVSPQDISSWLKWKDYNLDEKNRLITLTSLCLSGATQEAKNSLQIWRDELLLRESSLAQFTEQSLDPKIKLALVKCLN